RLRNALLKKGGTACPVRKSLQEHGAAPHRAHQWLLDLQVVANQIELGLAPLGEEDLAGAGDRNLVACRFDTGRTFSHYGLTIPAWKGGVCGTLGRCSAARTHSPRTELPRRTTTSGRPN